MNLTIQITMRRVLPLLILLGASMKASAGPIEVASASSTPDSSAASARPSEAVAIFAGGCFWCMEPPFDKLPGVISTTSGYTGGRVPNPDYEQVSSGGTGHAEAIKIVYDPALVSFTKLLDVFWRNIDPFAVDYQFCDHGDQYRSGIFAVDAEQMKLAEQSKRVLEDPKHLGKAIATQIVPASTFYPAEDYHQDYYTKNPVRYKYYRYSCGRDKRLEQIWGGSGH